MFFEIDDIKRRHSVYFDVYNGKPHSDFSLRLDYRPQTTQFMKNSLFTDLGFP